MQIGSAYSGLDAVEMVSKSVQMVNDLNRMIATEQSEFSGKMMKASVAEKVTTPSPEATEQIIDTLA